MKKNFVVIMILTLVLFGCSSTKELAKVTLMLDYTPNTNHSGIYTAIDKGYYEDYGIDLEIVDAGNVPVEQAVSTQEVEFGISYEENLTMGQEQGLSNLISIYAILKENTSGFMSYKEKGIEQPSDFEGKTYCGWGSEVEEALVKEVAKIGQVNPDDVNIVLTTSDFLRSSPDDCDIFWEFEGWAGQEAKLNNIEYNYIPLKDLGIDFYTPIIITSKELIDSNEELVQKFVNATIKGYEYAAQNPADAANIFLKYNPSYDEELIKKSQEFVSAYYINDQRNEAGYQEVDVWKSFTTFLYDNNIVEKKNYKGYYTNEYVNNYYKS